MAQTKLSPGNICTFYGVLALIFWGFSPAVICHVEHIPVFQLSMILQFFSFFVTLVYTMWRGQLKKIFYELPKSLSMVPFLVSTQVSYIFAFRMAPVDQVDLINYLWPMMTVVGSSILFSEKLSATRVFGILVGFSAIVLLGHKEIFSGSFDSSFVMGYLLAFTAACSWTIYTLMGRSKKDIAANEHIGFHVGISAFVVSFFHFFFDDGFVPMQGWEWSLAAALGVFVYGLGYPLWWYGLERGKFALLTSLSYLSPILSIWVLVLTGVVDTTIELCIACLMVAVGSWLVNQNMPILEWLFQRVPKVAKPSLSHVVVFADFSQEAERDEWNAEQIDDYEHQVMVANIIL